MSYRESTEHRLFTAAALGLCLLAATPALPQDLLPQESPTQEHLPGCAPEVHEALVTSAEVGVARQVSIVRHPDQGIRDPDSLFGLSCIDDLFNYRHFNVHFDPGRALDEVLNLAKNRICAVSREVYGRYVGRALDSTVYAARIPRLPGLDVDYERGNLLEPLRDGAARDNLDTFRGIVGAQ